jgi:hypothetical protein
VRADASGSSDSDGRIVSYQFDFGDGTVVGPQAAATATHTYAAGNWTATVQVMDDGESNATASTQVTATPPNQPPHAALTVTPSSGNAPLAVAGGCVGLVRSGRKDHVVPLRFRRRHGGGPAARRERDPHLRAGQLDRDGAGDG